MPPFFCRSRKRRNIPVWSGWCLGLGALSIVVGCQNSIGQWRDRVATRNSFLGWNWRSTVHGHPCEANKSVAWEIISRSPRELAQLMQTLPPPPAEMLEGEWRGINKGFGAAWLGVTQDIKVFERTETGHRGYNVKVRAVPIPELDCRGWQPEIGRRTGCVETMGNFCVVIHDGQCECSGGVQLDYPSAPNRPTDPSRWLIDDLVMIDDCNMLGRAFVQWGQWRIPAAYFVLTKAPEQASAPIADLPSPESTSPTAAGEATDSIAPAKL